MDRRSFLRASAAAAATTTGGLLFGGLHNGAVAQNLDELLQSAPTAGKALFGSTEVTSATIRDIPQWSRVLSRMKTERRSLHACLDSPGACSTDGLKAWREVIGLTRGKPELETLKIVNRYFNRWPYKEDRELHGVSEFWATPREFMQRSGDCEDFSIAKFFALRDLGFDNEQLRVVILMDRIRRIGHAVLAVYALNDILILDSLTDLVFSHEKYRHYVPQYSMNETTRWAHFYGANRTASL